MEDYYIISNDDRLFSHCKGDGGAIRCRGLLQISRYSRSPSATGTFQLINLGSFNFQILDAHFIATGNFHVRSAAFRAESKAIA